MKTKGRPKSQNIVDTRLNSRIVDFLYESLSKAKKTPIRSGRKKKRG